MRLKKFRSAVLPVALLCAMAFLTSAPTPAEAQPKIWDAQAALNAAETAYGEATPVKNSVTSTKNSMVAAAAQLELDIAWVCLHADPQPTNQEWQDFFAVRTSFLQAMSLGASKVTDGNTAYDAGESSLASAWTQFGIQNSAQNPQWQMVITPANQAQNGFNTAKNRYNEAIAAYVDAALYLLVLNAVLDPYLP